MNVDPDSPPRSCSAGPDSPVLAVSEEAAGDSSSIDVLYPEPSDSDTGGLFPGSAPIEWSSPDSSGEGRNHEGGQDSCGELASRPGNSRIPGKDHRRYYHSHWRLEYLMDFNARSHSMVCMVCGSSLATLKLSTIKRHIQQKHPYSITWTLSEKEVIIGSWDTHLCFDAQAPTEGEEQGAEFITESPGPKKKRRRLPPVVKGSWRPVLGCELLPPPPPDRTQIEQFMNESLKQWFRLEYLMDYDSQGDRLHCMICSTTLPGLAISDVKDHILDNHPTSVYFSPAQKGIIVETWIKSREDPEFVLIEEDIDDEEESELDLTKSDTNDEEEDADDLIIESTSESKVAQENVERKRKDKEEQITVSVLEEDNLGPAKVQRKDNSEVESEMITLLEEEDNGDGKKRCEERKSRKGTGNESEDFKEKIKTLDKQKGHDPQDPLTLGEQIKPKVVNTEKLLEDDKYDKEQKAEEKETVLEEDRGKAKEMQLAQEKNKGGVSPQLEKSPKGLKTQCLEEEINKVKELARLQKEHPVENINQEEENGGQLKAKEVQTTTQDNLIVDESIVKIEDEEIPEPLNMCIGKVDSTVLQINVDAIKKEQNCPKLPEGIKLTLVPEKQIIQVKQVKQVTQTPAMLGIGVPLIKVETPTPIVITRVSGHPIITPAKPMPSTSTSDGSKGFRIIAPKVSTSLDEAKIQTVAPSTGTDPSPLVGGLDPLIWEVSLWQGTSSSSQPSDYQLRWRTEFMMDYNGLRGSIVCMYCCTALTILKESSIKRHIVQKHPHTSKFSAEEKEAVIRDWDNKIEEVKKLVAQQTKDGLFFGDTGVNVLKVPDGDEEPEAKWSGTLSEGRCASWDFVFGKVQAATDINKYQHDRWKLEFLMDYTPAKDGLICMVCGVTLINPKMSTIKFHIQQNHPNTMYLSDQEKSLLIEEWQKRQLSGKKGSGKAQQPGDDDACIEINDDGTTSETNGSSTGLADIILPTLSKPSKPAVALPPPCNSAKRSYQVRWRTEFMMDYDCRRQGLICMVCGGTLATLKVSTIKRHIVQVHPYSVDFAPEERQRILEAYSEMALHYIHSEECFKAQPQEEVKPRKRKSTFIEEA